MACDSKTFGKFLCIAVMLLLACSSCWAQDGKFSMKFGGQKSLKTNLNNFIADFDEFGKPKRAVSGSSGLFPFPRVGRSDPSMFNEYNDAAYPFGPYENYDGELNERQSEKVTEKIFDTVHLSTAEMRRQEKRQGLVPFPRVGRSSSDGYNPRFWLHENKRNFQGPSSAASSNAMWFGPR